MRMHNQAMYKKLASQISPQATDATVLVQESLVNALSSSPSGKNNTSTAIEPENGYDGKEKRAFFRHSVEIDALVQTVCASGRVFNAKPTVIKNISLAGVGIELPTQAGDFFLKNASQLEIVFTLRKDSPPLRFNCELRRLHREDASITAGLNFIDCSFYDYKQLAKHYSS